MEIYLIILVILLALGIFDLYAGVANDAVNFTNSAVGSKAGSFKLIMIVASIGMIAGVTLSSGMMEVARKGIFNPEYFTMPEILMIFTAVMIGDVLLLDLFNTFGLPTSTTVSLLSNLLGASIAFATFKIISLNDNLEQIFSYINTANVLKIFTAIFISIAIAFIVGALMQFLARLIFTFDTEKRIKRYGSIWGGITMAFISFFILLKGVKGASFMTEDLSNYINNNFDLIILFIFIFWTVILALLQFIAKINIFKVIVIVGTFSLAMAFAANDLVNFIGAPLGGLNAFMLAQNLNDPLNTNMDILNKPIQIDTFILIAAGLIMAMTLYLSKKARTVTRTEVGLGSQEEVYEIFQSNAIARSLVRMVLFFSNMFNNLIPLTIKNWIRKRFSREKMQFNADEKGELPAFDLIRASVIIMVSTALISLGTSLKLPLSTTYVTFIVAMAAALSDRAWGRDSAVYRVSGVVTVVGGWFLTSLIAIIASFILATIIFFGKIYAIIILVALATFIYLRTNQYHKNKQKELRAHEKKIISRYKAPEEMILGLADDIENYLTKTFDILLLTLKGIVKGDLKQLKKAFKQNSKNLESLRLMLDNILLTSRFNTDESIESSQFHIKSIAALNTIADRLSYITKHNFNYFDNHHNQLNNEQSTEIKQIISQLDKFNSHLLSLFENYDFNKLTLLQEIEKSILADTSKFIKNQLKRMKKPNMNLKRSRLFISNLENTNTIVKNTSEILIFSNEINSMIK